MALVQAQPAALQTGQANQVKVSGAAQLWEQDPSRPNQSPSNVPKLNAHDVEEEKTPGHQNFPTARQTVIRG